MLDKTNVPTVEIKFPGPSLMFSFPKLLLLLSPGRGEGGSFVITRQERDSIWLTGPPWPAGLVSLTILINTRINWLTKSGVSKHGEREKKGYFRLKMSPWRKYFESEAQFDWYSVRGAPAHSFLSLRERLAAPRLSGATSPPAVVIRITSRSIVIHVTVELSSSVTSTSVTWRDQL